jgi:hypothetical protein
MTRLKEFLVYLILIGVATFLLMMVIKLACNI